MPDRLRNFLGKSSKINGLDLHSPSIEEISDEDVGEIIYNVYIALATFNKETVLKYLFEVSDEDYLRVENEDSYELLVTLPSVVAETEKALSFFTKDKVAFDSKTNSYMVGDKVLVDRNNYSLIATIVKKINGLSYEEDEVKSMKFKNEKAKQMFDKLQKLRSKYKKKDTADSLGLKDILSILCSADDNGINIFNVGQLTIYQVYERFERLNIKENHTRILKVWANGHLGKDDKLPEWIVKSKL
jgi:hypothetical protein